MDTVLNDAATLRDTYGTVAFPAPQPVMDGQAARAIVDAALARWQGATPEDAHHMASVLADAFPDNEAPASYWDAAASKAFRTFFVWGHTHDFGHGVVRKGAMHLRHIDITAAAVQHGMLAADLTGRRVLDIGCWSGGDLLVLGGLGADVVAMEEHPVAAQAAARLAELVGLNTTVHSESFYADRPEWAGTFDSIYCSGVVYHVTDPMLFLRIAFAYLKPGGDIFVETMGMRDHVDSQCKYVGTLEKGWNWYVPNETAFGRWLVDAGFEPQSITVLRRPHNRLIAHARKAAPAALRETAGFSRPGSWLEGEV